MRTVGIRELKQNPSAIMREVERGETYEVTDRGRPVARIVKISDGDGYEQLLREGRIIPGRGHLLKHKPAPQTPGKATLSEILAQMREEENR